MIHARLSKWAFFADLLARDGYVSPRSSIIVPAALFPNRDPGPWCMLRGSRSLPSNVSAQLPRDVGASFYVPAARGRSRLRAQLLISASIS